MRTTAGILTLAAVLSAAGAASPSFAAAAEPVTAALAAPGAAPGGGPAATGDLAQASALGARIAAKCGMNDLAMPPEMIAKLSPEQILAILREREEGLRPGRGILVPMVFFSTLSAMVLLAQVFATRRERMRQETLRAIVEKGLEIPPGLVPGRRGPSCNLRRGLVLVGAGLGLSLVFALAQLNHHVGSGLWSIGLVPMLMGAAYLVAWRIETRHTLDR